jgi:hypothetical protein
MHCSKRTLARLRLLCFRPHEPKALQALSRPDCVEIVEFKNRLGARWQHHPRLLGAGNPLSAKKLASSVAEYQIQSFHLNQISGISVVTTIKARAYG